MLDINTEVYDNWNRIKKSLQLRSNLEFFKERQIWWCNIGQNLGTEIYGKGETFTRPVLIYKKLSNDTFLGLPLTTKAKNGSWYTSITHQGQEITVLLNQVRICDKKRLVERLGQITDGNFQKIKTGFNNLYNS